VLESWTANPSWWKGPFYRESATREPSAPRYRDCPRSSAEASPSRAPPRSPTPEGSRPSFQTTCHSVLLRPTSSQSNCPSDNGALMIWLVGIKYKSLEWPNGLARASRQSVRVAVRIPMNTRVAILGGNLLPSLRRTQFLCRSCVVF
jgi:hypothetical protein